MSTNNNTRCDVCVSDEVHYERLNVRRLSRPANYCPECGRRLRPTLDQDLKESDGFVPANFIELHALHNSRLSLSNLNMLAGVVPEPTGSLLCFSDGSTGHFSESYAKVKHLIAEATTGYGG